MIFRLLLFLTFNFLALGLGGYFTGSGVKSEWYQALSKAPWTPPGWFFGFAWTSIMICFSIYMARLWKIYADKRELVVLYGLQWTLNVLWNPLFFYFRNTGISMAEILLLTALIGIFLYRFRLILGWNTALILPYFIWLMIASSLNGWIVIFN